jgi:hypothetical protein
MGWDIVWNLIGHLDENGMGNEIWGVVYSAFVGVFVGIWVDA